MRIRFNEEIGTIDIDGVVISASVLRELVNPDRRLLFRFIREGKIVKAVAYSEASVLWIDRPLDEADQTTDFGVLRDSIIKGRESQ